MKNITKLKYLYLLILLLLMSCGGKESSGNNDETEHKHVYEYVVIEEASCLKTGFKQQKCIECGDILTTAIIQKTDHQIVIDEAKTPTCLENGLSEGSHCLVCSKVLTEQIEISALGHTYNYNEGLSDSNYDVYVCEKCNDQYKVEKKYNSCVNGHKSSDWIVVKESTCIEYGYKHKICLNCETELSIESIPLESHAESILHKEEPTCIKTGLTEGKMCLECGKILVEQVIIDSFGHSYEIISVVEPTESKKGYVEYQCTSCNDSYTVELDDTDNYNPSKPTTIELSDNISIVKNNNGGVIINDNIITITMSGDYEIKGSLSNGAIRVECDSAALVEIKLIGVTINSTMDNPISVISANEVDISAKEGTKNYINDNRTPDDTDLVGAGIYSKVDLTIKGHGELFVTSTYNNGIGSTKDLKIKNLTLEVNAPNNAIKGNDSITVESGNITAISSSNDAMKTENSDISDKGNQRGIITIEDGILNLYAACDGIDASYDVYINGGTINIFTEQFSEYSGEVSIVSKQKMYIRVSRNSGISNSNYLYSAKFILDDGSFIWSSGSNVTNGMSKYFSFDMPTNAKYVKFFAYSTSQSQNQENNYIYSSDQITIPSSYDTYYITSIYNNILRGDWQNYSQQGDFNRPGMPGGGMQEGNPNSSEYSCKGIKADNSITINGGTITIKSHDDAIHCNTDVLLQNGSYGNGDITVNSGNLNLYSNDDAIHSDSTLIFNGSNTIIAGSYEGIEGNLIYFKNGVIQIKSSDDAINAKTTLYFDGSTVYLDAGGDGIDSNGNIYMNAGVVFALGPTNGGNGVIDYGDRNCIFQFNGGLLLAIGCSGMNAKPTATTGNTVTVTTKSTTTNSYLNITSNGKVIGVLKITKPNQNYCVLGYNNSTYPSCSVSISSNNAYNLVNGLYYVS